MHNRNSRWRRFLRSGSVSKRAWAKAPFRWLIASLGKRPMLSGVVGTIAAGALTATAALSLYEGRTETLRHAQATSQNLVATLASNLGRSFDTANLSLSAIVDGAEMPAVMQAPPELIRLILFDQAVNAPYIGGAYLLAADGTIRYDGKFPVARAGNFSDRDFFAHHLDDPDRGIYFSHPYVSRLRGGDLSMTMSRRVNDASGHFNGVAALAISISYFTSLIADIDPGPHGSVFIVQEDGTVLARKAAEPTPALLNISKSPTFGKMLSATSGSYRATSALDNTLRFYTFAHVPGTPFIVAVAPAESDVLSSWRNRGFVIGCLTLGFAMCVVLLSWTVGFSLRARIVAEARLRALATVDALTNLSNRRTFEERLGFAWRSAIRSQLPMTVLLVDVDFFKLFNDTQGHLAGDHTLKAVASALATAVRSADDVVARFGGEEFVLLLPDTDEAEASRVSERIRECVEALQIAHPASAHGVVTVSVGQATTLARADGSKLALLELADRALYAAKSAGRNRVSVAAGPAGAVAD